MKLQIQWNPTEPLRNGCWDLVHTVDDVMSSDLLALVLEPQVRGIQD